MDSRSLKHRVLLRRPQTGQDAAGQPQLPFVDVTTVWANILTLSGSETIKGGAEVSTVRASIRIRRRTDVNAGWQAVHGTKVYEIKACLPDENSREKIDLVCEVVNG